MSDNFTHTCPVCDQPHVGVDDNGETIPPVRCSDYNPHPMGEGYGECYSLSPDYPLMCGYHGGTLPEAVADRRGLWS